MDYTIVEMQPRHTATIAKMEKECFSDPWGEHEFDNILENDCIHFYIAENDDTVFGYAGMFVIEDEAEIINIAVMPPYRRHGIGCKMMSRLTEFAASHGARVMYLEVRESNAPAIALYTKFGFEPVGVRHAYYKNPREDAVIMKAALKKIDLK